MASVSSPNITLPSLFRTTIIEESDEKLLIRSNLSNEKECNQWVASYEELNCCKWIYKRKLSDPTRCLFHKTWACQHSKINKLSLKYRNTECPAELVIKIKIVSRGSKNNDIYLRGKNPLPTIITIYKKHNHNTFCAESLKYLRISESTKQRLISYFEEGYAPAQAMRQNLNFLTIENMSDNQCHSNRAVLSADSSVNPTSNMVYYLHAKWSEKNFGISDPIKKVLEKLPYYSERGCLVKVVQEGEEWAALVVTPVMLRNQEMNHSKEMVYTDTSSSCDVTQSNVTILSTVTKAGAVPLAVLVHSSQTCDNYTMAYQLLQDECPKCFGGNEAPLGFMSDDSAAERGALSKVWPSAKLLLCTFHVTQAEWRWILSNVKKGDRVVLMRGFQAVMYADTQEKIETAVSDLEEAAKDYPKFVKRLEIMMKRKEEWTLLYRLNLNTRGNNTNNYAEASIRVLKDIVLRRTKAFNLVALLEFCVSVWDPYFCDRLLRVANCRQNINDILYERFVSKIEAVDKKIITELEPNLFEITSFSDSNVSYIVNVEIGHCTCVYGRQGAFCKHQAYFHKEKKLYFPNSPPVQKSDFYSLAQLALGNDAPSPSFFSRLRDTENEEEGAEGEPPKTDLQAEDYTMQLDQTNHPTSETVVKVVDTSKEEEELKVKAIEEFSRILNLTHHHGNTKNILSGLVKKMSMVKTPNEAFSMLLGTKSSIKSDRKKGGYIKVQSTATSRRRFGVSRGSKTVPMGRPTKQEISKRGCKKRPRNISQAISQNVANAKKH